MPRKRDHIPLIELLASALADRIDDKAALRDLRERKVPAQEIVSLFTPDHIVLHAWDGLDKWWNIDMRQRGPALKAKDAADTTRAAKAKRIDKKWNEFMSAIAVSRKPPPRKSKWFGSKPKRRRVRHVKSKSTFRRSF